GLAEPFIEKVRAGTPTLGICLGMHLLFSESEEFGLHRGLDLIGGRVRRIPEGVTVPHMGWNQLQIRRPDPLVQGIEPGSFVYFVHSFYADPSSEEVTVAATDH